MYLPIGVVVVFSFNEARLPVRFTGIFPEMVSGTVSGQGSDPGIEKQFDPGGVQLWGICSDRNTGGCRTFQDPLENKRGDGVYFHPASDDPGNHSGNGTDGTFSIC